jgi:DNA-binding response OmpR family regulator
MAGEKILNIDDSPTVQRLIEMILSSQGYQVVLASDGEAGIARAREEKPAVILVDFVMPKMNGFQVCESCEDRNSGHPIILDLQRQTISGRIRRRLGFTECHQAFSARRAS